MRDEAKDELSSLYNEISSKIRVGDRDMKFVTRGDLRAVWTKDRLKIFLEKIDPRVNEVCQELGPTVTEGVIKIIRDGHLKGLSILVLMNWHLWAKLPEILMNLIAHNEGKSILKDTNFPYTEGKSLDIFFDELSIHQSDRDYKWMNVQRIFLPLRITEGTSTKFRPGYPLPFLKKESIGESSYGSVYSVEIAPYCFVDQDKTINTKARCFAVKTNEVGEAGGNHAQTARWSIQDFPKSGGPDNDNILKRKALFQLEQKHYILYDKAEMNLKQFLESKDTDKDFDSPKEVVALFSEFCALAGALDSLHTSLSSDPKDPGWKACHIDLKPENILVFGPTGSRKFKIADFAALKSRMNRERRKNLKLCANCRNPTLAAKASPNRNTEEFQAPEMQSLEEVGLAVDVWSLGCILIVFLIKAFGDADKVADFRTKRAKGGKHYFHDGDGVKKAVEDWIATDLLGYKDEGRLKFLGHEPDRKLKDPKGRVLKDPKGRVLKDPKDRALKDLRGRVLKNLQGLVRNSVLYDPKKRKTSATFLEVIRQISQTMKNRLLAS